jgi:head-tail adaptor
VPGLDCGALIHDVVFENPDGPPVPNGEGGFTTDSWIALAPLSWVRIQPASARDLERRVAGTVLALATHLVDCYYLAGITTETRMTKGPRAIDGSLVAGSREFHVTGVVNPEERNESLILSCVETVQ